MKIRILSLALVSAIALAPISSASAIKSGAACSKAGLKQTSGSVQFTCVKSGKKLKWAVVITPTASMPTPVATPTAEASPTPTPTATEIQKITWSKVGSINEIPSAATKAFAQYVATTRTTSTTFNIFIQPGADSFWSDWIAKSANVVAKAFSYPTLPGPFVEVLAFDKIWLQQAYKDAGFSDAAIADRVGGFNAGAPAFGGRSTNTWNLTTIKNENLVSRDRAGTAQTPGHEFFHAIQENLAKTNPGQKGEQIPNWFWEGPAMFVGLNAAIVSTIITENEASAWISDRFNRGNPATKPLELKEVKANDGVIDPYGIGAIATEYLVVNVGMEKFMNIYTELGTGRNFADAFKAATGQELTAFYEAFEANRSAMGFPKS